MPSSLYVPFLLVGMLLTGSSNSIWSKYQDMQCVENCSDPNPANHVLYEQPVWQTLQMFIGEMLCFLPVIYTWLNTRRQSSVQLEDDSDHDPLNKLASQPLQGWKVLLLWIPAACDLTGTTLMNVGLLYTPVSIYQMTRGALVLFVGVFSVMFLRRRLWLYQWVSLIIVMAGVGLVGWSGSLIKDAVKESIVHNLARALNLYHDPHTKAIEDPQVTSVLVGIFFVLFAQVFTATQFVVEEKIMSRYSVSPLVAVGFEGLFGTISVLMFVPIMAIPSISAISPFFDLPRGWYQMIYTPTVLYSGLAICLSISLFNFFGLSVTRHVSATARSLTDTCRTLVIWIISLGLGWEKLVFPTSLLQVLGFSLLVYGTFLFNDLVAPPPYLPVPRHEPALSRVSDEEEREGLLTGPLDETAALPADLGQSGFDVVPPGQHALAQGVHVTKTSTTHSD
ncbi:Solute carrier family 35 member F6 [Psilocybe cubensis]|uniref:Solute carrier family 35 member F6 n=2 Tax=Psilocybe cubensis TaxID=181762 RepID=A0ACB8H8C0_PSICU|nr:Solute carrier family 35 member F6 [Psilocybe cubensis]KAH9484048.1 Solute carrier family 35 member F6 [Psilocybe cubensis]